jgi:hypothetical protein
MTSDDLARAIPAVTREATPSTWIEDLAARAERGIWRPLRWRD